MGLHTLVIPEFVPHARSPCPVPPPKLPCEPPADEYVSTVSERTDHLYENSPSVLPRIGKLLRVGLTRERRGRRGVGSGRQRRRQEGRKRRQHRRAQIQRAWMREGWRRAEVRLEQRQTARWEVKVHNKWMATRRAKKVGGRRHRRRMATTTAVFNLKINDEDGKRAVARSKTSGLAATASQAATGAGSDDSRRRDDDSSGCVPASLCGQQVRVAGCWWGRGPRYRLGGGGKRGWVT